MRCIKEVCRACYDRYFERSESDYLKDVFEIHWERHEVYCPAMDCQFISVDRVPPNCEFTTEQAVSQ